MIRVTTNSTLYTYQKNLLKSSNQLYSAMNAMMSGRNFDSYAADPAGATRAFKIHSSLNATRAQAANNETVLNKFQTAWSIEQEVLGQVQELGQLAVGEGPSLARTLQFDELAPLVHHQVHVGLGAAVLLIAQIQHGPSVHHAPR